MLPLSPPGSRQMDSRLCTIPKAIGICTGRLTVWWRLTSDCRNTCNFAKVLTSKGVDIFDTGVNDDHAQRTGRQPP